MRPALPLVSAALLVALTAPPAVSVAQTTTGTPPVSSQTNIETDQNQQKKKGKVLFSRSTDANGQTTDSSPAASPASASPTAGTPMKTPGQPPQPSLLHRPPGRSQAKSSASRLRKTANAPP